MEEKNLEYKLKKKKKPKYKTLNIKNNLADGGKNYDS